MQIARKINFDDSQNAFYVRCSYVASQLICLAVYYYISLKVCPIHPLYLGWFVAVEGVEGTRRTDCERKSVVVVRDELDHFDQDSARDAAT